MKLPRPHLIILGLGLVLRLGFIALSDHIFYPDEIFQSLEQGYRLVYGYGLIPWEFRLGMRSWLPPGLVAGWLWLLKGVGITTPRLYIPVVQTFFSLLSLSVIGSSYALVRRLSGSTRLALVSAFVAAAWYELIYFAPRPFTEALAAYCLLGALALLVNVNSQKGVSLGAFLTGLGIIMRPQYILLLPGYIWLQRRYGRVKASRWSWGVGLGLGIGLLGLLDWLTWGVWFYSTWQYWFISLTKGISQLFGAQPWYFYLTALLATSGGFYLLGMAVPKTYAGLWGLVGAVLLLHSLIPHKEYRFIFGLIPFLLILTVVGGYRLLSALLKNQCLVLALLLFSVTAISALGMFNRLPGQTRVYALPLLWRSPRLQLYKQLAETPDVCGVWDAAADWAASGGYYYLAQPVPLYGRSNPPPRLEMVNYVIALKPFSSDPVWRQVDTLEGFRLYKRDGPCAPDKDYSYQRYLPAIERVLGTENHQAR